MVLVSTAGGRVAYFEIPIDDVPPPFLSKIYECLTFKYLMSHLIH